MSEKEIRDRIKALQAEINGLKAQLPKKERKPRTVQPQQPRTSSFMRMAEAMINNRRAE